MKLFVSYARVDKPLCKQIVDYLQDVHEVWYDRRLHAGQAWWDEIRKRLGWCEGFVYLLSPESVASEYCQREFAIAAEGGKHIFPVLIQAKTPIPDSLQHIHYADLSQGTEDIVTLMNALTVAERQQYSQPQPVSKSKIARPQKPPQDVSPSTALGRAADAIQAENYDSAVFIINQALDKQPTGRTARLLTAMLTEAEAALEQQTYLREAAREYAPIQELVKREATRALGCQEFAAFRQDFPDYDPDNIATRCEKQTQPAQKTAPPVQKKKVAKKSVAKKTAAQLTVQDILPPPFEWIEIPAGRVTLEEARDAYGGGETFDVAPFAIAKYPVTVAQYAVFMEAEGYEERRWWTDAGWEAREEESWTEPRFWQDERFHKADHPIVGVSWYEAVAFCHWLAEQTGQAIRLPAEIEWQWAAQGNDGRAYPWGDVWDPSRCNYDHYGKWEERLEKGDTTSPVTRYEGQGDSPFGVVDMVGNVWEWCTTDYESGSNKIDENAEYRVLRGGSWLNSRSRARAASRLGGSQPFVRDYYFGFRLVVRRPPSSTGH